MRGFLVALGLSLMGGCVSVDFATGASGAGASDTGSGGSAGSAQGAGGAGAGGSALGGAGGMVPTGGSGGEECANTNTAEHCGECFHNCEGGECVAGACGAAPMLADPIGSPAGLVVAEGRVFWLTEGAASQRGVWRLSVDADPAVDEPTRVVKDTSGFKIIYHQGRLYWSHSTVNHAPADASEAMPLNVQGIECIGHLAFDSVERLTCRDYDMDEPATAQEKLARFMAGAPPTAGNVDSAWASQYYSSISGIAIDGDTVYFGRGAGLSTMSTLTGVVSLVGSGGPPVQGDVVVHGGNVIFGDVSASDPDTLKSLEIGSAPPVITVLASGYTAHHIHVDDEFIYFAGASTNLIRRYNRSAQAIDALIEVPGDVKGIAGDAKYVFATVGGGGLSRIVK